MTQFLLVRALAYEGFESQTFGSQRRYYLNRSSVTQIRINSRWRRIDQMTFFKAFRRLIRAWAFSFSVLSL